MNTKVLATTAELGREMLEFACGNWSDASGSARQGPCAGHGQCGQGDRRF